VRIALDELDAVGKATALEAICSMVNKSVHSILNLCSGLARPELHMIVSYRDCSTEPDPEN